MSRELQVGDRAQLVCYRRGGLFMEPETYVIDYQVYSIQSMGDHHRITIANYEDEQVVIADRSGVHLDIDSSIEDFCEIKFSK